jgi:glycosyltransferase involved in cell wall biosynthesis
MVAMREQAGAGVEEAPVAPPPVRTAGAHYSGDLVGDAERYARLVVALARHEQFDVVHAHDWLTYPAGIAMSRVTGRPLVVHVHSTEFDRSGDHIHQALYEIERRGMHAADRVLAVSSYTKSICVSRYGVPAGKVDVVYNGIDRDTDQPAAPVDLASQDKIVLFLGRITMQKGPEYFIAAAKRVLEKVENVKFVLAGSGDMTHRMIELAAQMGIGHKVLFTGFLRGRDVERVFRMADCYVMPSVSEPFGIAALEAIHHDVPVILSKQSGASEVLSHVLKVDFWDVDEMANKIVAVLRHPPLTETLRHHGPVELGWLTWDGAAGKCVQAYGRAIHDHLVVRPA